jgi:hypothetical protein
VHDPIQLVWQRGERLHREREDVSLAAIRKAMHEHLHELGEPAAYTQLHSAGLAEQAEGRGLMRPEQDFDEAIREVGSNIQQAIEKDVKLERMDSDERSLEVGLWDLKEGEVRAEPLADRVERAVVNFLLKNPSSTILEIEQNIYPEFPGLLTPSKALVGAVLDSYGTEEGGRWRIRDEDKPATRRAELEKMTELIALIGERLGYPTEYLDEKTCAWVEDDQPMRVFYLLVSAVTGKILVENQYPLESCMLVLPGGRASLLAYKQQRDSKLRQRLEGWQIVKFRLLRTLGEIPVLNRQTFDEQLISDPIEQTRGQLMMF